ncbi:MAG TPA: DUF3015 family protein [Nitrospiraceae bacterium]|jgi:hypothetical protein
MRSARVFAVCGILALGLSSIACNTTKATVDTTVKFFSSTSPDSMFTADGMVAQDQKIKLFAGVAYENLRQEAAAGSGQYVTSLAVLYDVPPAEREAFGRLLQTKYTDLFVADLSDDRTAHLKMVDNLNRILVADASLVRR